MSNIDVFDQYAGQVLALLYEAFPVPIDFSTAPTDLDGTVAEATAEARKNIAKQGTIRFATASWLAETCYFQFEKAEVAHRDISDHFELEGAGTPEAIRFPFRSLGMSQLG
jgi:hypothetical protein